MNILVADADYLVVNLLEHFKDLESNLKIFNIVNNKDGLEQYKNNDIDLVILDFSVNNYSELLLEIMKINKFQKTITISESLTYSENLGCDFCIQNHHRIRLLKPIKIQELIDTIQNFDTKRCKYFGSLENIENFISDIERRYLHYKYDSTTKQIMLKNKNTSSYQVIQELVDIINNLNEFNIKYSVTDDTLIQLL